ncbi:hypothetical protein ETD86_32790 [Nonomuraea turkmeniaca]|uniref:Uncharacterized protein n=1 Tax=Nonomuraea turkmeniaca TaxID=103838 RepID=A0A5S4F7V6_9ACTN|nr:NUDIX domain-containing protein [Nonomuraea turkmeniaca]TMR12424.1 hypothetical protein ETD86_32790 [Nonomuraea turkmeniaca]
MRTRRGARVVLLDRDERILLVQQRNDGAIVVPGPPVRDLFWIPASGDVEDGEDFLDAAAGAGGGGVPGAVSGGATSR